MSDRPLKVALWAGIALAGLACAPPGELGDGPATASRQDFIRNGTREPEVLPQMTEGQILALGWLHPVGRSGRNFCTGTVIGPRLVATAKHCTEGQRAGGIAFGVGLMPEDPVASVVVERIHEHPQLDAALLYLAQDITQVARGLEPIPFNRQAPPDSLVGQPVQAGGYGETYDRSRTGRYFARVWVDRIRASEVVVNGRGEQGICYGDSGGPILYDFSANPGQTDIRVLGVESWGDPSCVGRDYLVRLDVIADWLDARSGDTVDSEPASADCGDIDFLGECDGNTARWCGRSGTIETRNCRRGQVCRYVDDQIGYFCAESVDECGGVPTTGICEGDTVVRCRTGTLAREDCAAAGETCAADAGGAFCRAPWPPPAEPDAPETPDEPEAPLPEVPDPSDERPDAGAMGGMSDGERQSGKRSDGCSSTPHPDETPSPALLLALGALLGLRRRR